MNFPVGILRSYIGANIFLVVLIMATNANALEQPEYEVLYKDGKLEYRMYKPYIVAETVMEVDHSYRGTANQGFMRLFRYISGDNTARVDIAVTAAVKIKQRSEKIAMTAPVQRVDTENGVRMAFMIPSKFTMDSVPLPQDERIELRQVPAKLMAVLRYSGRWSEKNFKHYEAKLRDYVAAAGIDILGPAESAAYNPPFMPPFMRRNEVMFEVSSHPSGQSAQLATIAGQADSLTGQ
ncbi:MAG: heme-binding protein [Gammaproteobacteria bacterium]|nr:heme-binding protein [Gammaproteobacteria bacterium]MCY4357872.1 heme-binding protein [Gammaproteobacteria bacterium]